MRVQTSRALGEAVRQRRLDLAMTQQQLADEMGVSRKWVNAFENGKGTAQLRLVFDILHTLGLTVDIGERSSDGGR